MKCWTCESDLPETSFRKIGFREVCEKCDSYLHCCVNCKFYQPGLPNDCKVPGTDQVRDRESFNYCDEFFIAGDKRIESRDVSGAAKKLFGDDEPKLKRKPPEDRFNSLFGD